MLKRILMIAFHYPPIRGSSGVQRTLSFSRYIMERGWEPTILTVAESAFPLVTSEQLADIPDKIEVHRAFALDTARHLSVFGWYPKFLALPDRWRSWYWSGRRLADRLELQKKFDLVWSTYPIPTAHRIGAHVARAKGIPWVADFRDGMFDEFFPEEAARRAWHQAIEAETFGLARKVIVTTAGAKRMYEVRYPDFPPADIACIPNGYDERIFGEVETSVGSPRRVAPDGCITLLHSGILYPDERDPSALFSALAALKRAGEICADSLRLVFRGSRYDDHYRPALAQLGIDDIVALEPGVDYREALQEMYSVDGLLLLQSATCNQQIPAKVYEYARVRKPLLALTDSAGDTAGFMNSVGYGKVVPLDDAQQIATGLLDFIAEIRAGTSDLPRSEVVEAYSRRSLSLQLADVLDTITG